MNSELLKTVYTWAVIVLAAVAVWHLVNRHSGKRKWSNCAPGSPADTINPTWWSRSPVRGPRVSRKPRPVAGF